MKFFTIPLRPDTDTHTVDPSHTSFAPYLGDLLCHVSYSAARGGDGACSQSGECRFEGHAARGAPPQHGQVEGGALSSAEFNETPPEGA